jgi:hypothetical protein
MADNKYPLQQPPTAGDKLLPMLRKIVAADKRNLSSEDLSRLEDSGNISDESVRTTAVPSSASAGAANNFPQTPASPENGNLFRQASGEPSPAGSPAVPTQLPEQPSLTDVPPRSIAEPQPASMSPISFHGGENAGNQCDSDAADPLEDLLSRALARPRRGQPAAFDAHSKGKLVALLSLGMSLRQAAAVLGVSHTTIHNTLKADPALAEEITAARFQAQLQPLACVIREARRSWKAATWLLKYLDSKIASHEETPDERRDRQRRETAELVARATGKYKP